MPFETFDLGRIIATAEGIKGMRRDAENDKLRQAYLGQQMSAVQQAQSLQKQEFDQATETREATRHYLAAQAVEQSADPIAAAKELAPEMIAAIEKQYGQGSFDRLPPDVVKKMAGMAKQKSAAAAGINLQPNGSEPNEIRTLRALQNDPELLALHKSLAASGASNAPANVQEWQYYSRLSPQQQKAYLEMKRSQQTFLPTIAEVPTIVRPGVAGNPTETQPLTTLPDVANAKGRVAGAEAGARTASTAQAEAAANLQSNLDEVDKMEAGVKGLLQSPGFNTIYGASGKLDPRNYVAGTEAANSEARRNQLEAASFGISIQKMKGLGQLSNAEGQKVTAAYTRAVDRRQSEEAAREAWGEVLSYLELAKLRAQQKARPAGTGPASPPPNTQGPVQIQSDADYAQLPSGAQYIAPDGSVRVKR